MRSAASFAIVLALAGARPGPAEILPTILEQAKKDATALFTIDNPPSATELGLGLAALGLLAAGDQHLSLEGQRHLPSWLDHFNVGGEVGTTNIASVVLVGGGLLLGEHRGTVAGLTLFEGNVLLDLVLNASKSAFGRARPNQPHAGDFRQGGDSFPSSHAAHAFMIAAVLDAAVERPAWRWVFYPLASGVALARIEGGFHFPTDVAVGGLLGWWIGHRLSVAHGLDEQPGKLHLSVVPVKGGASVIASVAW
ncbi:MAG: phosphatase PAP2 family protein [Thermoanaerobaculales bacterium]